jgi:hypothetical protein
MSEIKWFPLTPTKFDEEMQAEWARIEKEVLAFFMQSSRLTGALFDRAIEERNSYVLYGRPRRTVFSTLFYINTEGGISQALSRLRPNPPDPYAEDDSDL